jgi:Holliday junction resolvase RusA-like endonuclease
MVLEIRMPIKPFSTNKMHYANKKVDTVEYKRYKLAIFNALKKHRFTVDKEDKYKFSLVVGYSSKLSDLDNAFKPLLDSMQRVLEFDDRQVFEIEAMKDHVKKGEEFIMVRMEKITDNQWKRRLKKLGDIKDDIY